MPEIKLLVVSKEENQSHICLIIRLVLLSTMKKIYDKISFISNRDDLIIFNSYFKNNILLLILILKNLFNFLLFKIYFFCISEKQKQQRHQQNVTEIMINHCHLVAIKGNTWQMFQGCKWPVLQLFKCEMKCWDWREMLCSKVRFYYLFWTWSISQWINWLCHDINVRAL